MQWNKLTKERGADKDGGDLRAGRLACRGRGERRNKEGAKRR